MSSEDTGRNKRTFERVRIATSKNIWNLSMGGAYVATKNPRHVGSLVHFEYKLGGEEKTFKALSKVVRVLHRPNPKSGEPAGMALQFIKVSDEDKLALTRFLSSKKQKEDGGPGK